MHPIRCTFVAATLVGGLSLPAHAVPITYTFSGEVTGSLGGVDFTQGDVRFVLDTDTTTITALSPSISRTADAFLSFTVAGVSGTFDSLFHVFLNTRGGSPAPIVGLSPQSGNDLLDLRSEALGSYDLSSPIGPVTQFPADFINIFEPYATSAGDLIFIDDDDATLTFVATGGIAPVPLPGGLMLLGTAIGLFGLGARTRRAKGN